MAIVVGGVAANLQAGATRLVQDMDCYPSVDVNELKRELKS